MNFAQKILQKYGWKEGEGLGKNSDGISKPLKASLKFDNAGLGVDRAEEFNNHWWERVFNDAAKNVEVKKDGDKISVETKNDSVEITTKSYSTRKLKEKKHGSYDNFLSASTLVNTGDEVTNPFKIDANDIKVAQYKPLTDEELFEACGGRTAHKGARHGLKLSGKLARIEKQEKEMLMKMQAASTENSPESWTVVKNKKKNKRKSEDPPVCEEQSKLDSSLFINEYCIKSKKKRKEKKRTEEELSKSLDSFSLDQRLEETTVAPTPDESTIDIPKKSKKKSKKKSNEIIDGDAPVEMDVENYVEMQESVEEPSRKKQKKNKHGIEKDAKETHKKAKKLKKKLRHIAEDLQQAISIEA